MLSFFRRKKPQDAPTTEASKTQHYSAEELAAAFPDPAEHLRAVEKNIVGLQEPFELGWYYRREIGGSFAIGSVLPAVCPDGPVPDRHDSLALVKILEELRRAAEQGGNEA